jgi:hypothetical protein
VISPELYLSTFYRERSGIGIAARVGALSLARYTFA